VDPLEPIAPLRTTREGGRRDPDPKARRRRPAPRRPADDDAVEVVVDGRVLPAGEPVEGPPNGRRTIDLSA
jgi:hypothetical protein